MGPHIEKTKMMLKHWVMILLAVDVVTAQGQLQNISIDWYKGGYLGKGEFISWKLNFGSNHRKTGESADILHFRNVVFAQCSK